MLRSTDFAALCREMQFSFFTGVPDSTYKAWMAYLESDPAGFTVVPAVNECEATAIAAGYHLATNRQAVVYMQNSGFGKTVNPLTSLCGSELYRIPMLLMIGWRGEPGKKDAHQHRQMGAILLPLLDELGIPYEFVTDDLQTLRETLGKARGWMQSNSLPFALIVRQGIFEAVDSASHGGAELMKREEAISTIVPFMAAADICVATTGKTSRELNEVCLALGITTPNRFYNPGAMGCAPSIALGIALEKPASKVFVMDGDGALLMQLGALATISKQRPANFHHILFDNGAHESTGGQRTSGDVVDFRRLALTCGYRSAVSVATLNELGNSFKDFAASKGPNLLIVKIRTGSRSNLSRLGDEPVDRKNSFMNHLASLS